MPFLLLLLIGIPVIELYVLIEVGSGIGAFPTVWLVVFTAALGIWLVRRQGLSVLARVRASVERDEPPALELAEGALLLLAGLALLIPGFVTDAVGFLLLVPPLRRHLVLTWVSRAQAHGRGPRPDGPRVIEGDWRREDPD
jgi:UPF0716 protein FxsA